MIGKGLILASLSLTSPADIGQSPYQVALEYCEDKGGLALYTPRGDVVEFSCGDNPSEIFIIKES